MENWIQILVAFVQDDQGYQFGTQTIQDMKVATLDGKIEIEKDERWDDLVALGKAFAGNPV